MENNKLEKFISDFKSQYDIDFLRKQFENVYFIIGTAYAGKSTMLKMLSDHYDGILCEENYGCNYLADYGVNVEEYPCLCYTDNHSMEEFVSRSPDEYYNWLRGSEMEITPIEISELLKLTTKYPTKKIFVDTSIPMEILKLISGYNNVVVMVCDKSLSVDRFFDRPDFEKQIIFKAIKNTNNPETTLLNFRNCMEKNNCEDRYNYFLNGGFYVFKRDDTLSLEETMQIISKHFAFSKLSYKK